MFTSLKREQRYIIFLNLLFFYFTIIKLIKNNLIQIKKK